MHYFRLDIRIILFSGILKFGITQFTKHLIFYFKTLNLYYFEIMNNQDWLNAELSTGVSFASYINEVQINF